MLALLSPAKSLDYESPLPSVSHTQPRFVAHSKQLIALLRDKSPQDIADLMSLSDALAALNVARYQAWSASFNTRNARPAVLAFNGDVYEGLSARSLSLADLEWAQAHVGILSGLYGLLRPLDLMQPYRLEMGTRLSNPRGKDLYRFWGGLIAETLNAQLASDSSPVVVNLASQEYFKAVDQKLLKARVVECVFEERRPDGQYKVVSFMAKRARGLMARHIIEQRLVLPQQLQSFVSDGYAYSPAQSEAHRLVFRRG